jgi:tetratricopeptide (TPR) repeat protein
MPARAKALPLCWSCVLVLAFALDAAAAPESTDAIARARKHYAAGRALYDLGNYNDALREFTSGYELAPKPLFLLDIGQCHRKLHDYEKARQSFSDFLERATKDEPARARALQLLKDVDREAESEESQPAPEPPKPIAPVVEPPPPIAVAPPPPPAAPPPALAPPPSVVAAPDTAHRRARRRLVLGLTISSAILVAAGVSVGLVFALRPDHYPASAIGTIHFDL